MDFFDYRPVSLHPKTTLNAHGIPAELQQTRDILAELDGRLKEEGEP